MQTDPPEASQASRNESGYSLSIAELEKLLDGIIRSQRNETEKRAAVADLAAKFAPEAETDDKLIWP